MPVRRLVLAVSLGLAILVGVDANPHAQQDPAGAFAALGWQLGPTNGDLGGIASITVPEGYQFVGQGGAGRFLELLENPSNGDELGVLLSGSSSWFVVFSFSPDGYVADDERDLDADAILASIKEGTEQSNDVRRERGWSTLQIVGWQQKPFYDQQTHNLTWAIQGSSDGSSSINHSTRLLGRRGVMNVDLVLSPDDLGAALPAFTQLLTGFTFNPGHRYAEYRSGDKIAEYGLTGLIVGGAGVALVKTGLLQKFWKVIVLGLVAAAGAVKRLFAGVGRGSESGDQHAHG
jgi:uncharacterized membrane-anchored protein